MKKFLCAFLSLVILCSCSADNDVRVVNKGLGFEAHIFNSSQEYLCSGEISEDMKATFKVTEGVISGFGAVYFGENVSFFYEGKESDQYNSFSQTLFAPIREMFLYLENNEYSVVEKNNEYTVTGNISAGEFILYISPAGLPISAQIKSEDFRVDFYDVSIKNADKN